MKAQAADLQIEVVRWLARLPFLGADELSLQLGTTKPYAARILGQLEDLGWAEWITPSSPELETERLYVLRHASLPKLPETLCLAESDLEQCFPVGRREVLERLLRLETVVGLNRFAAQLVAAVRDDEEVELAEFRSLPWRRLRAESWWPHEVEAYGCLRWGSWRAPFFVAWDRAGAPPFHRRKRVSAWYAFRDAQHAWGRDNIPPILIVCPGQSEAMEWAGAVPAPADRRKVPPLLVFLTDVQSAFAEGPLGPIWRRPDGTARAYLCERLAWRPAVSLEAIALPKANLTRPLEAVRERTQPLREWAKEVVVSSRNGQQQRGIEHPAALSIATSPMGRQMLEWLGHHPLLPADDLSVILRMSSRLAQGLLDRLVEFGLVDSTDRGLKEEPVTVRRYFLTRLGLRMLAARDGVPPRRYSRHGIIASPSESKTGGSRLETLIRQLDHTVGANRFFIRLIAEGGSGRPRLVRWLSPSEAALKFTFGEITHWLRPDGAGDIYWKGKVHRFYLEWDRGTIGWSEMTDKFRVYAGYLASLRRDGCNEARLPAVLIVTTSPSRERVIGRTLEAAIGEATAPAHRAFTSLESLVVRAGPWGPIWRGDGSEEGRRTWL